MVALALAAGRLVERPGRRLVAEVGPAACPEQGASLVAGRSALQAAEAQVAQLPEVAARVDGGREAPEQAVTAREARGRVEPPFAWGRDCPAQW